MFAKATGDQISFWDFFVQYKFEIPLTYRYAGACKVALINPSSAICERVFALYTSMFDDQSRAILEDRREASVMLRMMSQNLRRHKSK